MPIRKMLVPYRGLPAGVYVLAIANVVNNLGSFVWPLMSLLLTDRHGLDYAEAGLFVTGMTVFSALGALIGGKLADHLGRKRVFLVSRTLGALAFVPCAFLEASPVIPWLFVASAFLSSASWPCVDAMVTDLTRREDRQPAFSLQYLGLNIGFALGPMIAGFLYRSHLAWLYLGDALTTLLSSILVAVVVPETMPDKQAKVNAATGAEVAEKSGVVAALLKRPKLLAFSLIMMVLSFVYVQYSFVLPLQAKASFPVDGPKIFGALMTINALVVVFGTAPLTFLLRNLPPAFNLGLGALLYAFGFGANALIGKSVAIFTAATFVWSVGEVILTVNSMAYIANNSPVTHRGRFNAVFHTIADAGRAAGPAIMGWVIKRKGIGVVWPVCFFLAGPAAMIFFGQAARGNAGRMAKADESQTSPPVP